MLDKFQPLVRAVFRAMLSTIFITAGLNHLLQPEQIAGRLATAPMAHLATWIAEPQTLVLLAGAGLLSGGVALLMGVRTRLAALVLLGLIIPITLTVQIGSLSTMGPFFKNVGLAGGLLYFIAHGTDAFSIDSWLADRTSNQAEPLIDRSL